MKRLIITIAILLCLIAINIESSDNFSINGYYKNFFVVYDMSDSFESILIPDKPMGIVSNRIRLDAKINISGDALFDLSYSITPRIQDNNISLLQTGYQFSEVGNYRFDDFDSRLYPKSGTTPQSFVVFHNLDRAYFSISLNSVDMFIGRQAIAWGSARTVNPTDVFTPYNFDELDAEERIGVDAIRFSVPIVFMGEFDAGYLFGEDF